MSTYKEMSEQLDALLQNLQNGELDLDDAVKQYDDAGKLIKKMEAYLMSTQNKITKIKANLKKGA